MNLFNMGGYGVQGSDPNLAEKIARLKSGKPSAQQKIDHYLEHEMGIDPRSLPFSTKQADACMQEQMTRVYFDDGFTLVGNSMGLKSIEWMEYDDTLDKSVGQVATEADPHTLDWHDCERAWASYVKQAESDGTPAYAFHVAQQWDQERVVKVEAVKQRTLRKNPSDYPPGTLLRIERLIISEEGKTNDRQYVTVGTIFSDDGVTILKTRQPMTDLTGWSVIEEL